MALSAGGLIVGLLDQISATPRVNKTAGLLADWLSAANDYANRADPTMPGGKANPVLPVLSSLLGLPAIQKTLERVSYGEPLTNAAANVPFVKPETADAALALAPVAAAFPKAALGAAMGSMGMDADAARAAIVWHGSPHKFDAFDASKIGTGEGAQAYGHGLYLAENPAVAQSYKEALGAGGGNSDADTIARLLDAVGGDSAKAAAEFERRAKYANIPGGKERLTYLAEQVRSGVDPRGSLYKVDLPDEKIARMLDWDKPIGAGSIADAVAPIYRQKLMELSSGQDVPLDVARDMAASMPGHRAYRMLGAPQDAAAALKSSGIPGIRYLDGGSRSAGQGSSNFVVFPGNEGLLTILERNGVPLGK